MKWSKRTRGHIIGWAVFLLYQELEELATHGLEPSDLAFFLSLGSVRIVVFYLFYGWVWRRFLQPGRWPYLLALVPLGVLLFPALRYAIEEVLYPATLGFGNYIDPTFYGYLRENLYWRGIPVVVASLVVYLLEQRSEAERRHRELLEQKTQSELAFLRGQLNPHFLFNTLSYLYTEAFRLDASLANTVLQLSDMLRYALQSAEKEQAPIAEEVQLLQNYMAIFEKRFKGRFFANFSVEGEGMEQKVEPLLLMPFFENALKHGLTSDPARPVVFTLSVKPGRLHFSSLNYVSQKEKDQGAGIGLDNVKRRLALRYPGRYELQARKNKDTFRVDLTIDL